jgi:hypothetical protein
MINKKSQSAMEYLMTYGWAILVVLIALGALFYLGVFSPKTPNTCTNLAPFTCQDVKFDDSDNQLTLRLGASGVNSITYVPATAITLNGVACAVTNDGDGNAVSPADNMKSQIISVTCTENTIIADKKFSGNIQLVYDAGTGLTHPIKIEFSGTAEA